MGRAGPMGQLIMDFTGPVLGWAWSTWTWAGLGRELVSPWRTLLQRRPSQVSATPSQNQKLRHWIHIQ